MSGSNTYPAVGAAIARRRRELGLSQAALASAIGLTRTSISNIEKGRQKMLLHTFLDIATALAVPPEKLLVVTPSVRDAVPALRFSQGLTDAEVREIATSILPRLFLRSEAKR